MLYRKSIWPRDIIQKLRSFITCPPLLRSLISATALVVAVYIVPLDRAFEVLEKAQHEWVLVGFLLSILERLAAAGRTQALSGVLDVYISRCKTLVAMFVASFWSLFMPGLVAGSVVSAYYYRQYGAEPLRALGLLTASRIVEFCVYAILTMFGLLMSFRTFSLWHHITIVIMLFAVGGSCLGLLALRPQARKREDERSTESRRTMPLEKISNVWTTVRRINSRQYLISGVWAAAQCMFAAGCFAAMTFSLEIPFAFKDALFVSGLVYFAGVLPISVAGLGIREVVMITLFEANGMDAYAALAVSVLLFCTILINSGIGGILQLAPRGFRPHSVRRVDEVSG